MDSSLFQHKVSDVCQVDVHNVIRQPKPLYSQWMSTQPSPTKLGPPQSYTVHAGYRRVLVGFIREIEFVTKDHLDYQACLSRATYLIKILDKFAEELKMRASDVAFPYRFRSQVLNPILQRQCRGLPDEEDTAVKLQVGTRIDDAVEFYLRSDPLDPQLTRQTARQLLYVWPVRLSLSLLGMPCDQEVYLATLKNTLNLATARSSISNEEWEGQVLTEAERAIIRLERLEPYFDGLITIQGQRFPSPSQALRTDVLINSESSRHIPGGDN